MLSFLLLVLRSILSAHYDVLIPASLFPPLYGYLYHVASFTIPNVIFVVIYQRVSGSTGPDLPLPSIASEHGRNLPCSLSDPPPLSPPTTMTHAQAHSDDDGHDHELELTTLISTLEQDPAREPIASELEGAPRTPTSSALERRA
jgi:hypothetical protein